MMKKLFVLFGIILLNFYGFSQVLEPVKWSFSSKANGEEIELVFTAEIEPGWHLYDTSLPEGGPISTSFVYENDSKIRLLGNLAKSPSPTEIFDENFGLKLRYYENRVVFKQKVKLLDKNLTEIKGYVEFMSCNDETCTPPIEADFAIKIPVSAAQAVKTTMSETVDASPVATEKQSNDTLTTTTEPEPVNQIANAEEASAPATTDNSSRSLWMFFFFSFLAGLAAILTPCVFPMIPMTVSFFMRSGESKLKSKLHASFYGVSIIAIYTIIGTVVSVIFGPDIANWLSTHWIPNLIFFVIFMVFAFSFFGMFEIVLPSWLVNKSDSQVDKGGFLGAFFMALTLVLVSFSCTGPIVGAILVESAGGQVLKPIIGMFGFSLAFALPFTLFALFPAWLNNLPKSGGWLNSVKVVLGFLELALGLKFLSVADQTYHWGILDREVYLALWIVIFTLLGLYLLGKLKFSHDSDTKFISVPKLMLSIASFAFVVYLIPGMFGAPLKAISGYLPPQTTHDFDLHKIIRDEIKVASAGSFGETDSSICEKPLYGEFLHLPHGLEGYFDYEQGLACAKKLDKPVFIDFTGHGCVNCREMEAAVWSDPRVLQRLRNDYVVVALYVDDKTELSEDQWIVSKYDGKTKKTIGKKYADFQIVKYGVNAQPYYVLLDHEGNNLVSPKAYDLNPDNFVAFLDEGVKNFKAKKAVTSGNASNE